MLDRLGSYLFAHPGTLLGVNLTSLAVNSLSLYGACQLYHVPWIIPAFNILGLTGALLTLTGLALHLHKAANRSTQTQ